MAIVVNEVSEVSEVAGPEIGTMVDGVGMTSAEHGHHLLGVMRATVDDRTRTTGVNTIDSTQNARGHLTTDGTTRIGEGVRVPTDVAARSPPVTSSRFPAATAATSLMCRFL